MTSFQWDAKPLLEKGFYYRVLTDLFHLKQGSIVRVMNAQYHQAPKSDEGGYIIEFPDIEAVRLDHNFDQEIIKNIGIYLQRQEMFDWEEALAELKNNFKQGVRAAQEEMKDETYARNRKIEELVKHLVETKGMTAKEAYKHIGKNGF